MVVIRRRIATPLTLFRGRCPIAAVFLVEFITFVFSLLAVTLVHVGVHAATRRCPRCRLPAGREAARTVVHADAPALYETWEAGRPALRLVTPDGEVPAEAGLILEERPVRRLLQRRETLVAHRCRLCGHAWQVGEVEVVRGPAASFAPAPGTVRVFPGVTR